MSYSGRTGTRREDRPHHARTAADVRPSWRWRAPSWAGPLVLTSRSEAPRRAVRHRASTTHRSRNSIGTTNQIPFQRAPDGGASKCQRRTAASAASSSRSSPAERWSLTSSTRPLAARRSATCETPSTPRRRAPSGYAGGGCSPPRGIQPEEVPDPPPPSLFPVAPPPAFDVPVDPSTPAPAAACTALAEMAASLASATGVLACVSDAPVASAGSALAGSLFALAGAGGGASRAGSVRARAARGLGAGRGVGGASGRASARDLAAGGLASGSRSSGSTRTQAIGACSVDTTSCRSIHATAAASAAACRSAESASHPVRRTRDGVGHGGGAPTRTGTGSRAPATRIRTPLGLRRRRTGRRS